MTMSRLSLCSAIVAAIAIGGATAAFAASGEYNNLDAMSLVRGKPTKTDCSISAQVEGKTYCFGEESARVEFMKDAMGNRSKAEDAYEPCRDDPSSYAWCSIVALVAKTRARAPRSGARFRVFPATLLI
jgi:hypothetical protein